MKNCGQKRKANNFDEDEEILMGEESSTYSDSGDGENFENDLNLDNGEKNFNYMDFLSEFKNIKPDTVTVKAQRKKPFPQKYLIDKDYNMRDRNQASPVEYVASKAESRKIKKYKRKRFRRVSNRSAVKIEIEDTPDK